MFAEFVRLADQDEKRTAQRARRAARTLEAPITRLTPDRPAAVKLGAKASKSRRQAAARKGWDTRRRNADLRDRQTFKANPYEVEAGDFAYQLYDNTHLLHGDPDTIDLWDRRLRGYYGSRVKITLNGYRTSPETGERHRIFITRVFDATGYDSFFGPGSVYAKMIKVIRNLASKDELVTTSLTVELASGGDSDGEGSA